MPDEHEEGTLQLLRKNGGWGEEHPLGRAFITAGFQGRSKNSRIGAGVAGSHTSSMPGNALRCIQMHTDAQQIAFQCRKILPLDRIVQNFQTPLTKTNSTYFELKRFFRFLGSIGIVKYLAIALWFMDLGCPLFDSYLWDSLRWMC